MELKLKDTSKIYVHLQIRIICICAHVFSYTRMKNNRLQIKVLTIILQIINNS
jgi:hypothetical protein